MNPYPSRNGGQRVRGGLLAGPVERWALRVAVLAVVVGIALILAAGPPVAIDAAASCGCAGMILALALQHRRIRRWPR